MPRLAEDQRTLTHRIRVINWLVWGSCALLIGAVLTEKSAAPARSSHLVAGLGLLAFPLSLAVTGVLWLIWGRRSLRPVAAFRVGPAEFNVPHSSLRWAGVAGLAVILCTNLVHGDSFDDTIGRTFWAVELVIGAIAAVLALIIVGQGRQAVQLTATRLRVTAGSGTVEIPWDALVPGGPNIWTPGAGRQITLLIRSPEQVTRRRGPKDRIIISSGPVDPAFLARSIRDYVDHPEHRTAIGTDTELERLRELRPPLPVGA